MKAPSVACLGLWLAFVPGASAQGVVLGGWSLPEGTMVTSTGRFDWDASTRVAGADAAAIRTPSSGRDSTLTTIRVVTAGRPSDIEKLRLLDQGVLDTYSDGELVDRQEYDHPLVGVSITLQRAADVWTASSITQLTPQQAAALSERSPAAMVDDPEYPMRAVQIGETWEVDSLTVAAIYGALDPSHEPRLVVRLDSVGTFEGAPAAFISQEAHVALLHEDGSQFAMAMRARIVRRLDWMLDALTAWEGTARSEISGPAGTVVTEGWMRRGERLQLAPEGQ